MDSGVIFLHIPESEQLALMSASKASFNFYKALHVEAIQMCELKIWKWQNIREINGIIAKYFKKLTWFCMRTTFTVSISVFGTWGIKEDIIVLSEKRWIWLKMIVMDENDVWFSCQYIDIEAIEIEWKVLYYIKYCHAQWISRVW
jgi:hypothetical protein